MPSNLRVALCALAFCVFLSFGCSEPPNCKPGFATECPCVGGGVVSKSCKDDGSGFGACVCPDGGVGKEPRPEPKPEPRPETRPEPRPETRPEPKPEPRPEPSPEPVGEGDASLPELPAELFPDEACDPAKEFNYLGKCYSIESFCQGKLNNGLFPTIVTTRMAQEAIQDTPYKIQFSRAGIPEFCETKKGYYFLRTSGYGRCDNDKDGWLNILGYSAVTSTDKVVKANARCELRKIDGVLYVKDDYVHKDGANNRSLYNLQTPAPLVESLKNDGLVDGDKLPVYTVNQAPLPQRDGSVCDATTKCTVSGEVCYRGIVSRGRGCQRPSSTH